MKKLPLIVVFILSALVCTGQKINKAEYFIDSDPGYGLAIPVPVTTPANDVSLSFKVNASGLIQGFHMMVARACDDQGLWGTTLQQVFYVYKFENVTELEITGAEYFIDTDPGFGMAVPVTVETPATRISLSYAVDITGLSQGFHMMVVRARDETGRWSNAHQQGFYVYKPVSATSSKIDKAEYFIDTDPGFENAVQIPVSAPAKLLELNFTVDLSELDRGFHMLVARARNEKKNWSNTIHQVFYLYKEAPPFSSNTTGVEYFIDSDPGFGNGTQVAISVPSSAVTSEFTIPLTGLTAGDHILFIRARDAIGRWSTLHAQAFSLIISGTGEEKVVPWFRMVPNPNAGTFTLDFSDLRSSPVKITISDLNGRIIYSDNLNGEMNSVSVNIPDGVYLLKAESGQQKFTQHLIIKR